MKRKEIGEIIKKYLAENGSKGGRKGGKSKSEAKKTASAKNLETARLKRWPKR